MRTQTIIITLLCGTVAMFLNGCALDPDRKLDNAIDRYNQKEPRLSGTWRWNSSTTFPSIQWKALIASPAARSYTKSMKTARR